MEQCPGRCLVFCDDTIAKRHPRKSSDTHLTDAISYFEDFEKETIKWSYFKSIFATSPVI